MGKITSGTPTTIAGYGITDAYTKTEVAIDLGFTASITGTPTTMANMGLRAYAKRS
jgi:hypothetical protein